MAGEASFLTDNVARSLLGATGMRETPKRAQ
jgi:hypothetical protein